MIALFSINNDYNQPANNLVALFNNKPSIETLAEALELPLPCTNAFEVAMVKILDGNEYRIGHTSFRLETINFFEDREIK